MISKANPLLFPLIRRLFIVGNLILAVYYAREGIRPYLLGALAWDEGLIQLFIAFWFIVACIGLYANNVWLVSVYFVSLSGLILLNLFITGLETWSRAGASIDKGSNPFSRELGVLGMVFLSECFAVWANIKTKGRNSGDHQ
jgi:hypothetical protein